jgi:hypothetical protein
MHSSLIMKIYFHPLPEAKQYVQPENRDLNKSLVIFTLANYRYHDKNSTFFDGNILNSVHMNELSCKFVI